MATITTQSQLHEQDAYPSAAELKDQRCLLCNKAAEIPFVVWTACGKWLVMHTSCAEVFAWGLLRDSWEIQLGDAEANIRYYVLGTLCGLHIRPFSNSN